MKKWLKRLAWSGAVILCFALAMLHTQPVEMAIWRFIVKKAEAFGWQIKADRLDISLFALKIKLQGLYVSGDMLDAKCDLLIVDGAFGLLTGQIDFDAVLASNGFVNLNMPEGAETETPKDSAAEPLQIPPISLGNARVENMILCLPEGETSLDFVVDDIGVAYTGQELSGMFTTPPIEQGGLKLPAFKADIRVDTTNFQVFEDIHVKIFSDASGLDIQGSLEEGFRPNLKLTLMAGDDLPQGFPVTMAGSVIGDDLSLEVHGEPLVEDKPFPIDFKTGFNYRSQPLIAPIEMKLAEMGQGQLVVDLLDGDLNGIFNFTGNPESLKTQAPVPGLEGLEIFASFKMPGMDPNQLTVDVTTHILGDPSMELIGRMEHGQFSFQGEGEPIPHGDLSFAGHFDPASQLLTLDWQGLLPGLDGVGAYVELPPEACSGPVRFSGKLTTDLKIVEFDAVEIHAQDMTFDPYFKDDLHVWLNGPPEAIEGSLFVDRLNPGAEAVSFIFDARNRVWKNLDFRIDSKDFPVDDYRVRAVIDASGMGPLLEPELKGILAAALDKDGAAARLNAPFQLQGRTLTMPRISGKTAHGSVSGLGTFWLEDRLDWQVSLRVDTVPNKAFQPLLDTELPIFALDLFGDRSRLEAGLTMPDQFFELDQAPLFLDPNSNFHAVILPDSRQVEGSLPELRVAGVVFSELDFDLKENGLQVSTGFQLEDAEMLEKTFCSYWVDGLELGAASGILQLTSDLKFENPVGVLVLDQMKGKYQDEPLLVRQAEVAMDERVNIMDFQVQFAGVNLNLSQADQADAIDAFLKGEAPKKSDIALSVNFVLEEPERLRMFLDELWPEDLDLNPTSGQISIYSDLAMENPGVSFSVEDTEMTYWNNIIQVHGFKGFFNKGLWFEPFGLDVGDLEASVEPLDTGFRIHFQPTADDIGLWYEKVAGDAVFDGVVEWNNRGELPGVHATLRQKSGRLVHKDPWMALSEWSFKMDFDWSGAIHITEGKGKANGGEIEVKGRLLPEETGWDAFFNVWTSEVQLDLTDYHANLTSATELKLSSRESKVTSTLMINGSYLTPDFKDVVASVIGSIPELNFPDPFMESVDLQLVVLAPAETPIVVENELVYLEMETPSLVIKGNLAQPRVNAGVINITEGSALELGKQSFVFKSSQILFNEERPDDPYLDISLESTEFQNKNEINLNGYLSSLGESLGENNFNDIIATFLIGNVISFVSLENVSTDTLFESSATAVASQRVARRILARYSYPIFEPDNQRVELVFGPVSHNFLSLSDQKGLQGAGLLHTRQFGYPDGQRPERIKRIRFNPKDPPRWVKKGLGLARDDDYTPTQWRRAENNLARTLKKRGHLNPAISHEFNDSKLLVNVDMGPQTHLVVKGLTLSEKEEKKLLASIYATTESGLQDIASRLERIAVSRGHPFAAAMVEKDGHDIRANVLVGHPIPNLKLDFGPGQKLLDPLYATKAARQDFIVLQFSSEAAAHQQIRARLAALGYLNPSIGEGDFTEPELFVMPVFPGQRGVLARVFEGDTEVASPLKGQPFSYDLIEKVRLDLEKKHGKNVRFDIIPRADDGNVALELKRLVLDDPTVHGLDVINEGNIKSKKIRRFLGYKDGMKQSELSERQRRLTENGPFRSARLQTVEGETVLNLVERNRWDANVQINWDTENDFGTSIQAVDHQFLGGINDLAVNIGRNSLEEEALAKVRFQRVLGTPLDFVLGVNWINELRDNDPQLFEVIDDYGDYGDDETMFIEQATTEEITNYSWTVSYPYTRHQTFSTDLVFQDISSTFTDRHLDTDMPDEVAVINRERVVVRLGWLYRRLDSNTDPRNGIFANLSVERYFNRLAGVDGSVFEHSDRYTAKLSTFKSWGRLLWTQRFEWGKYEAPDASRPENLKESPFFLLGGSTNVRGFSRNFLGPLDVDSREPLGGEGLFFFSEEGVYDVGYQGLGAALFVDGGWNWERFEDMFDRSLVTTGGLGLVWNSPVGYFRIDWAHTLDDRTFIQELENTFFTEEDIRAAKSKAISEWSFRFGRVF